MKIIICCFGLLLAIPASANSLDSFEKAACRTSHLRVEQMANSEKSAQWKVAGDQAHRVSREKPIHPRLELQ
ncbi:hypothetical protein [Archangium sp.]|uniref:hypothetical protein n=1 Tax=Archangium sp. TaxID=1872627 RepID=UPI002D48D82A|nr:hypothetical protein [Archangium sp.]HYO54192.1 hypothetical protein [Archangium sp.]